MSLRRCRGEVSDVSQSQRNTVNSPCDGESSPCLPKTQSTRLYSILTDLHLPLYTTPVARRNVVAQQGHLCANYSQKCECDECDTSSPNTQLPSQKCLHYPILSPLMHPIDILRLRRANRRVLSHFPIATCEIRRSELHSIDLGQYSEVRWTLACA